MLFLEKMAVELDIFKSINCHNAPWPHLLHNILFESLIVKKTMQSWLSRLEMTEHIFLAQMKQRWKKNFGAAVDLEVPRQALIIINILINLP